MEETDHAFAALNAELQKNVRDTALTATWQQTREAWHTLEGKVRQGAISVDDSFSAHSAMISQLLQVKWLLMEHYELSFDPEAQG